MPKTLVENRGACWRSNLELPYEDDETESVKSASEELDNLKTISVGPFMNNLFEKQLYTDVDFYLKNSKSSISAHKAVLAAKCEFFENLLFGNQKDTSTGMKMKIEISNVSLDVFKDILRYFYTDDINLSDVSSVLDIRSTAHSFEIQSLTDQCEIYLETLELDEDNVCSTLQISSAKNAEDLKTRCTDYIKKNTLKVISSPDFEKCSFTTVLDICNLQDLNLKSESEMLEAVLRWINVQPDHTKKELKKSLLKCIRFLSFKPEEMCDVAKKYPDFLENVDAISILVYLNKPTDENMKRLPKWMNKSRRTFSLGLQEIQKNTKGKIQIPLKLSDEQQEITEMTCILQMKCVKGDHLVKAMKFLFEYVSNEGNMIPLLVANVLIVPTGFNLCTSKAVDSKEIVLFFDRGVFIHSGQTFHLEVKIKASQSCRFLQFDASLSDFENEHFQCSIASKPKQGRFFFIKEVTYGPRPRRRNHYQHQNARRRAKTLEHLA